MTEDYSSMCELQSLLQSLLYPQCMALYLSKLETASYLEFHVTKPVRVADASSLKYTHWTSILATWLFLNHSWQVIKFCSPYIIRS